MQVKDSKVIRKAVVLVGVVALTGAIGVGLSAQMGPRQSMGDMQGPGGPGGGPGMMGGGPGGPFGMFGRGLRELDLTDTQREQVRGIAEAHKNDFQAIGDRMKVAREALHEAVTSGTADEGAIRAKAAAVAVVEADAAVLQAKVHAEVFAVLTPEQQQKAKELRETMKQRMKNGRERMRQSIEQRRGADRDQERGGPLAV
jgi:Spy/CpxP family protein refolding chaperone